MRQALSLALLFGLSFAILYLFWIIFVGSFDPWELAVGAIGAMLGAVGLCVVQHANDAHFRPRLRHWLEIVRVPWYVLQGTWEIAKVSLRDLFGGKPAESLFRLATFDAGEQYDPEDTARRTLANVFTTMAPNFVILGINVRDRYLLFHQIEKSSVPKLTKDLGARP